MKDLNGDIKGKISFDTITLDNIEFSKIYYRHVTRSNKTSGKVNIPENFIGEEVIIAIPKKKSKKRQKNE